MVSIRATMATRVPLRVLKGLLEASFTGSRRATEGFL